MFLKIAYKILHNVTCILVLKCYTYIFIVKNAFVAVKIGFKKTGKYQKPFRGLIL